MEFDQSYNGTADWSFPSPGATPTTGNFNQSNVLHTPKTATFPSQFFQDAFNTPQMPAYTTPRQPEYATMTPLQRPAEMLPNTYYPNMPNAQPGMVHHGQPGMPPPSHAGHQAPILSPAYSNAPIQPSQTGTAMSFDTSQMQTPPPTRGTSAKKPTPQQVAFGTPSTIASRRFVTPQQVIPLNQHHQPQAQAPMQFPQLHFSPNVYQFGNLGPASAPVFPQTQLLWEQTTSPTHYNQQQMLDDPFAPQASDGMPWPVAPVHHGHAQSVSFNTPDMSSFPVHAPIQRPASAAPVAPTQPQLAPPPVMTSAGVDPSLVYSSPIRPLMPSNTPQSKPRIIKARPEIKRKDSSRTEHQRTSSAESVATSASKEPQRNNAVPPTRPHQVSLTPAEPSSRRNSLLQPPRTGSPLKRIGKVPMGSISESKPRPQPSVVLTIDETGLARTETRRQDLSPTQSIRERYPGLFDSDSSDEESEDEDQTPSRSTSFSFAKGEERRSKAVKLDPPVENLVGLSIPRSSSSASMKVTPSRAAIAAAAQLRRGGSLRKQTPSRSGSRRIASTSATSIDTAPMNMSVERQQASQEQGRSGSALDAHNRRWSMMSLEQQQSVSPTQQMPENPYQQLPHAHPGHYQQLRQIRCSCGIAHDRGQPLVQCYSCTQWSHAACINPPSNTLPPTFTCFLCTIPTSGLQVKPRSSRKRS